MRRGRGGEEGRRGGGEGEGGRGNEGGLVSLYSGGFLEKVFIYLFIYFYILYYIIFYIFFRRETGFEKTWRNVFCEKWPRVTVAI